MTWQRQVSPKSRTPPEITPEACTSGDPTRPRHQKITPDSQCTQKQAPIAQSDRVNNIQNHAMMWLHSRRSLCTNWEKIVIAIGCYVMLLWGDRKFKLVPSIRLCCPKSGLVKTELYKNSHSIERSRKLSAKAKLWSCAALQCFDTSISKR